MIGFYCTNGVIYARYKSQKEGKLTILKYFPGIKSDGFDTAKRRFRDQELNNQIVNIEKAINDIVKEQDMTLLNSKSFTQLIDDRLTGKSSQRTSFFTYCDNYYQSAIQVYEEENIRSINTTINLLREHDQNLCFEKIDKKFYREFMAFMHKKEMSKNYTGLHIKNLKTILNHATDSEVNSNLTFREFKKPTENVFNVYLNEQEIEAIYNLKITELTALELQKENQSMYQLALDRQVESLDRARKLFVLGCWTGLRVENYLEIDPEIHVDLQKGFIHAIANKGGVKLRIPLHKLIREIVESGGFPESVSQQKLNKQIKVLGKLAGLTENIMYTKTIGNKIKKFTQPKYELLKTHTARRSFASNLLVRGVPEAYIMAVTAHSTVSSFRKYVAQVRKDTLTSKLADFDFWY
jgi:site-specific recombinase XerD